MMPKVKSHFIHLNISSVNAFGLFHVGTSVHLWMCELVMPILHVVTGGQRLIPGDWLFLDGKSTLERILDYRFKVTDDFI